MDDSDICPLQAWFDAHPEVVIVEWAQESGIAFKTIFDLKAARRLNPKVDTLAKIEAGTGGEVTLRQMLDWINRQKRKQA